MVGGGNTAISFTFFCGVACIIASVQASLSALSEAFRRKLLCAHNERARQGGGKQDNTNTKTVAYSEDTFIVALRKSLTAPYMASEANGDHAMSELPPST